MRNYLTILLTVLLSFSALAEMNPRDQKLAEMMLSGDIYQLKIAAKGIRENEINNQELLDIATEVLLTKHSHALSSEVDTLAWLARAIGVSENGRYYSALSIVESNATDKRLKKHAKKAMKDIGEAQGEQYIKGMYTLPNDIYAKEDDSVRDKRIMGLLTNGDLAGLKEASREVADLNIQNQEILDFIAEVLISNHATASDHQIDTFSWAASALGHANNGRYFYVLEQVEENGAHRKLRKYAKQALKEHGEAKGEQYKEGMLGKALPSYDF